MKKKIVNTMLILGFIGILNIGTLQLHAEEAPPSYCNVALQECYDACPDNIPLFTAGCEAGCFIAWLDCVDYLID